MLLGHPFIYTFYEIMGSLTKYRLSVILYGSKGYTNLKEIAAKSKLTDTTVSIPITASYYVYDTNKVKSGALEATALINVKYD
ncbi:hypothetical protein EOL36_09665 [Escherichia coli]|nr:hypothetical protein EOL36_09665 [Escherichia coli]